MVSDNSWDISIARGNSYLHELKGAERSGDNKQVFLKFIGEAISEYKIAISLLKSQIKYLNSLANKIEGAIKDEQKYRP